MSQTIFPLCIIQWDTFVCPCKIIFRNSIKLKELIEISTSKYLTEMEKYIKKAVKILEIDQIAS